MGRLKLRPPSEAARARYLVEWPAKELVFNLEAFPELSSLALFHNQRPLEVEVGPGTGDHLCALAQESPDVNFLGIEASRKAVYYAVHLAEEQELGNIFFVRANVKLLYGLFPEGEWQSLYLHFPDPVHKTKDSKNRIFDQAFLNAAHQALAVGGEISVVSDNEAFFEDMLAFAERDERFVKGHAEDYLEGFEPRAKSRFQRAWERKGIVPRQFLLRKKA